MKFAIFGIVALLVIQAAYCAEEWQCEPKVPYIENECNGCFCTENRLLGCTEKACLGGNYQTLFNCELGTTFPKGCNTCWCVKGLGTICTNNSC